MTRPDAGRGRSRSCVRLFGSALTSEETVLIDGIDVTDLTRTVADLGRMFDLFHSVPIADAALARGLSRGALDAVVAAGNRRPGNARLRRMAALADARSESVGESCSRVVFHDRGVPTPLLQYEVRDESGRFVARSDFCWEAARVLGEFDGKVKYTSLLRPGESASDVVIAEKRREDALRNLGWDVVRWTWADLHHPTALLDRLNRAMSRPRPRGTTS